MNSMETAGSGKTTIALHRIAYLVYTYEKSFSPDNFMIFAPNRLFLNYILEVLPELGVENVRQTTFNEFVLELLNIKYQISSQDEKLGRSGTKNSRLSRNKAVAGSNRLYFWRGCHLP